MGFLFNFHPDFTFPLQSAIGNLMEEMTYHKSLTCAKIIQHTCEIHSSSIKAQYSLFPHIYTSLPVFHVLSYKNSVHILISDFFCVSYQYLPCHNRSSQFFLSKLNIIFSSLLYMLHEHPPPHLQSLNMSCKKEQSSWE